MRRRAFQRERIQRACPPIGPHGRTGTMPRVRRGDFDQTGRTYGRTRRRTPHVRMQAMPRATSIHRRSREQDYSCDATLAVPDAPAIEPPSGEPRLLNWPGLSAFLFRSVINFIQADFYLILSLDYNLRLLLTWLRMILRVVLLALVRILAIQPAVKSAS
jgi:hypothetical protein